jgi:RNA polymerase sigma factor (sigma-70 family)
MPPTAPGDSWKTWLMTGSRATPVDRRRVRGAHRGLKKILSQGAAGEDDQAKPWKDFSGAMVRHAVDEALNQLPPDHKEVLKLAYFGGLSNREIAERLGLSVRAVQRRLNQALAYISDNLERGRDKGPGRRVLFALMGWLAARRVFQALQRAPVVAGDHVIRTAAVLAVAAAAGTALAVHPGLPGGHAIFTPHPRAPAKAAFAGSSKLPAAPIVVQAPSPVAVPSAATQVLPSLPVTPLALPSPTPLQLPKLP